MELVCMVTMALILGMVIGAVVRGHIARKAEDEFRASINTPEYLAYRNWKARVLSPAGKAEFARHHTELWERARKAAGHIDELSGIRPIGRGDDCYGL